MLNISKYHQTIIGGAIVTVSAICLGQSAGFAQTTPNVGNQSNGTGPNVTTTNGGGPGIVNPGGPTGFTSTQQAGAGNVFNNLSVAAQNAQAATDRVNALNTAPTPAPEVEGPVRYSGVADAADCACPNADTNPGKTTASAPNPELEAAKAAEAEANAKLAAAKAEARAFIESVEKENATGSRSSIQIW